jgi:predicted acyltransferase
MNKNKKLVSYVIAILIVSIVILKYFQNFAISKSKTNWILQKI